MASYGIQDLCGKAGVWKSNWGLQFTDLCSCTELVHDVKCNPFCSRFDLELKQCVRIDVQTEKRLHFQSLCNAFAEATWCEYVWMLHWHNRFATCQDKWTWPELWISSDTDHDRSRRSGQVLPSRRCVKVPWLPHRWIPLTTTRSILWSATAWRQTQQLCSASAPQADNWEILGTSLPNFSKTMWHCCVRCRFPKHQGAEPFRAHPFQPTRWSQQRFLTTENLETWWIGGHHDNEPGQLYWVANETQDLHHSNFTSTSVVFSQDVTKVLFRMRPKNWNMQLVTWHVGN